MAGPFGKVRLSLPSHLRAKAPSPPKRDGRIVGGRRDDTKAIRLARTNEARGMEPAGDDTRDGKRDACAT